MRPTTRTTTAAAAVALSLSALTGLTACGGEAGAARTRTPGNDLVQHERLVHEARAQLLKAQQERQRNLDPNEHLARKGLHAEPGPDRDACRAVLTRAWKRLGHYSDGYERYLLRQPPCSSTR